MVSSCPISLTIHYITNVKTGDYGEENVIIQQYMTGGECHVFIWIAIVKIIKLVLKLQLQPQLLIFQQQTLILHLEITVL